MSTSRTEEFVLIKEKETTLIYQEECNGPPIFQNGKLYISKWTLGDNIPERLKLTIEEVE